MSSTDKKPISKAETRYARQLYLYGSGDGHRITNTVKLAEMAGVHIQTIQKWLPVWEKELGEILAQTSQDSLVLHLSKEKLDQHTKDLDFLRDQVNQCKFELENLDEITAKLQDLTEKFCDDPDLLVEALATFNAWLRGCGQKSSLRSQFLALQKQWTSLTGIVDMKDVAIVREKEIAKGKAKLEMKKIENETAPNAPRVVAGGVFDRPRLTEQQQAPPSEDDEA